MVPDTGRVGHGKDKVGRSASANCGILGHPRPGGGVQERLNTLLPTQAQASVESGSRKFHATTQLLRLARPEDKVAASASKTMLAIRSTDVEVDTGPTGHTHYGIKRFHKMVP